MTSHHPKEDCPICGGPGSFVFHDKHGSAIYHCAELICGHLWTNSLKSDHGVTSRAPDIQAESDQYLSISGERNRRLLRFFVKQLGKSKNLRFLDFGSGNAHISRSFKQLLGERVEITCLETNESCHPLYSRYGLNIASCMEEINSKFDLIYMIDVIEHLQHPISVLTQLSNLLEDRSQLFLSTPPGCLDPEKTNAFDSPYHWHYFTDKSLNLCLEKAGLEPIDYRLCPQLTLAPSSQSKWDAYLVEIGYKQMPGDQIPYANEDVLWLRDLRFKIQSIFRGQQKPRHYPHQLAGFTRLKLANSMLGQ